MLPVSAPFHCELMNPAARRLAAVLNEIDFKDLNVPLVTNVDAKLITSGARSARLLAAAGGFAGEVERISAVVDRPGSRKVC